MILTSSPGYWATGITLRHMTNPDRWGAHLKFYDDGFMSDDPDRGAISSEGELRTRYFIRSTARTDALELAIDTLRADAARLGITFTGADPETKKPILYFEGDGEDPNWPPPQGWRDTLAAQARRIGWSTAYRTPEAGATP